MNLFRTFLRRIKYNLTYLFGSKINIPSEFRLFERRKTNYETFINKHCRLTSHNKVNLNDGLKIFGNILLFNVNFYFLKVKLMAERVGFEPTVPVRVHTLSKRAP